jgi:hypothetical protein
VKTHNIAQKISVVNLHLILVRGKMRS